MDRRYLSGASTARPNSSQATSAGFPSEGNPTAPVPVLPTVPGPYFFHMLVEELTHLILDAGLSLDVDDLEQVRKAIDAKIAAAIAAISTPEGVTLATRTQHLDARPPTDRAAVPEYVRQMIQAAIANRITQAFADARYLRSIPSEYLTETEGNAAYQPRADYIAGRWLYWSQSGLDLTPISGRQNRNEFAVTMNDRLDNYRTIEIFMVSTDASPARQLDRGHHALPIVLSGAPYTDIRFGIGYRSSSTVYGTLSFSGTGNNTFTIQPTTEIGAWGNSDIGNVKLHGVLGKKA